MESELLGTTTTLDAVDEASEISHPSAGVVTFQIEGDLSGTITFQAIIREGDSEDWKDIPATNASTGATATTTTTTGLYRIANTGFRRTRAKVTARASGSASVTPYAVLGAPPASLGVGGGLSKVVSATLTRPADTTAYTAADEASNSTTAPTVLDFSGCARTNGGSGRIVGLVITDSVNAATDPSLELWLFDTTSTPNNDNAAFAPSDAVVNTVVAVIASGTAFAGDAAAGGNLVFQAGPLDIPFVCGAASTSLFGRVVVRNGYTPASAEEFKFRLRIVQD